MFNLSDIWFTVLRWTILAAAVGLVVGTPVVYFNHRIDQAYAQGKVDGTSACEVVHAKAAQTAADAAMARILAEGNRASAAEAEAQRQATKAKDLKAKLNEALSQPLGTDCSISESATGELRDASTGHYERTPEGSAVPSPLTPELQSRS